MHVHKASDRQMHGSRLGWGSSMQNTHTIKEQVQIHLKVDGYTDGSIKKGMIACNNL